MPAEHFSEKHRNTRFSNNVTATLRQSPGLAQIICGSKENYTGNSRARIENRFGRLTMQEKTERNSDTDTTELNSVARWIQPGRTKTIAPVVDPDDQMEVSLDLGSPALKEIADAAEAYHDDMAFKAFFGTAYTGKSGDDTVAFKAANVIAHGGTGLTKAKLLELRRKMKKANVNIGKEMPIIILQPEDEEDMHGIEEYTRIDYNGSKPLVNGELPPWLGFRFMVFNPDNESVPESVGNFSADAGATRQLPVICPRGLHMGVWDQFTGYIDRLPGKNQSMQYWGGSRVAAARTDEDLAWIIQTQ